ncbi:SGNH/GDSL hydrolase family protein [Bombilactobacillus thymidiniphilus]|uniref:SGNH/GDSL hydrolase family protein n=1 Tax=Bombilactobacillus thymidiniphilus TaxID=2923363 RepID=A0ABY4PEH5_9LACO|nr:SGNH/GDSL hydrolase family protein [Bombilactobacillus thymidiniphilus]UQS84068.1 SGNH/GDSL hydrolase family protein [Bombilactobacillus thymidiniphilus]
MTNIVLFGDDILGGVYDQEVSDYFTNLVQQALPQTQVVNCSIPGHKTSNALTHVKRDVVSLNADLVVLGFGVHDVSTIQEIKPGQFTRNLSALFETIGSSKIILLSPPFSDYQKQPQLSWPRQLQFTLAAEYTAQKYEIPFINLLFAMQDNAKPQKYLRDDGVNFNKQGYKLLLNLLLPAINQLFPQPAYN